MPGGTWTRERQPRRLSREGKARMAPFYAKIREAGAAIKAECTDLRGVEWHRCRSRVLARVFPKPASPAAASPPPAPASP